MKAFDKAERRFSDPFLKVDDLVEGLGDPER